MTKESAIARIREVCRRHEEILDSFSNQSLTSEIREMIQSEQRKALKELVELSKRL